MSGGVLDLAWKRYLHQLNTKPIRTKSITAGTLAGLSDLLAQRISGSAAGGVNWRRTLAIALYGAVWAGPASHYWQQILEKLFPNKKDPLRSVKKTLLDQLTFGPWCNALFMSYMALVVEGRSLSSTTSKLRVLWLNLVAFAWSTFLILRQSGARGGGVQLAARLKAA